MIPHTLPDYVERGGEQVWRPPGRAREVDLYGFVIPADRGHIDALLQRDLVLPSGGAVDYRCAHDNVVITFAQIGRESSGDPVESTRGYISEREVSIWCLVADVRATGRLLWYVPYIFTDTGPTVATGREIFGYPKQLGLFEDTYPTALRSAGGKTVVSAYAIRRYGVDQRSVPRPMIEVVRARGAAKLSLVANALEELGLFFGGGLDVDPSPISGAGPQPSTAITPLNVRPPAGASRRAPWLKGILMAVEGKGLIGTPDQLIADLVDNPTLVFLKQFRDVGCATKACYQAVIEAPLSVHRLDATYEGLNPKKFKLTIHSYAGDPIAEDLGVRPRSAIEPKRAFHAKFGFDIELGTEVWRAPT